MKEMQQSKDYVYLIMSGNKRREEKPGGEAAKVMAEPERIGRNQAGTDHGKEGITSPGSASTGPDLLHCGSSHLPTRVIRLISIS
ncbi:hypothetical protein V6N11_081659 [Hibiscus sabdariffa]|uniref:Uncharacterized protein n=2 Tax=Hibiscus sabdariffa TaxID=183260 RepID=A0ABR1Z9W6_9ROSI